MGFWRAASRPAAATALAGAIGWRWVNWCMGFRRRPHSCGSPMAGCGAGGKWCIGFWLARSGRAHACRTSAALGAAIVARCRIAARWSSRRMGRFQRRPSSPRPPDASAPSPDTRSAAAAAGVRTSPRSGLSGRGSVAAGKARSPDRSLFVPMVQWVAPAPAARAVVRRWSREPACDRCGRPDAARAESAVPTERGARSRPEPPLSEARIAGTAIAPRPVALRSRRCTVPRLAASGWGQPPDTPRRRCKCRPAPPPGEPDRVAPAPRRYAVCLRALLVTAVQLLAFARGFLRRGAAALDRLRLPRGAALACAGRLRRDAEVVLHHHPVHRHGQRGSRSARRRGRVFRVRRLFTSWVYRSRTSTGCRRVGI